METKMIEKYSASFDGMYVDVLFDWDAPEIKKKIINFVHKKLNYSNNTSLSFKNYLKSFLRLLAEAVCLNSLKMDLKVSLSNLDSDYGIRLNGEDGIFLLSFQTWEIPNRLDFSVVKSQTDDTYDNINAYIDDDIRYLLDEIYENDLGLELEAITKLIG